MAISKIAGQMLKNTLERDGSNLAISDTTANIPVVFVDITNSRVGVNNSAPAQALDITGNAIANNLFSSSTVSAVGNIIGGNVNTAGAMSATGNSTANFFIGNGSQLTGIDATSIQNGNSNVRVYANANVATSVGGTANVFVVTGTGADVTGTVSATGNITGNFFIGNGSQLTGIDATSIQNGNSNVKVYANSNVATSVAGTANVFVVTGTGANIAGTVNATGNLVANGVTLSGNAISATSGLLSLGSNANITITGGTANYVLSTDGLGNLTWSSAGDIGVVGNAIPLGTPTDGNLAGNTVAYDGWTPATFVTDSVDDLNQVALNIAKGTFVGQANLVANVTSGPSPLSVSFTGTYVGTATNFLWDFGDSTTASTQNPTKTYSNVSGGQFSVTFTAWNANGTYAGNAAAGAKGSVDSTTRTDYITLFTPLPIPSFTTSPTTLDTGSSVTLTNTSLYATSYSINYGDGNIVNPGNSFTTNSHTYTNSANVDTIYGINLTGTNQTAGNAPPYSVTSANTNVKVYTQQSPAITANTATTINYASTSGGVVSFRNDTPGTPGNTASFGAQQLYNFQWGDSTANSNINIQTGLAGNPGAANITHTFALTSLQQNAATSVSYTANLWLYTGFSTSPFQSSNVTITIEPEVRANFIGTSNTQTDATGFTSNAQVGYLYTDYNGRDRSLFNFQNNTSPNVAFTGNVFNWTWGDTTSNTGLITFANITHSYQSAVGSPTTGTKTVALQANGTPGTLSQSNTLTRTSYITILSNPTAPINLSGFSNVTIANTSQGTSPLLAAGATDNTGGNIVANGTSVTRFATTTPIATAGNVSIANTATTGTLTAYVNNVAAGNVTFTTGGNTVGTAGALVVSADRDLHISNAAVPTGFYKVFSANISNSLASLSTGYNNYKFVHSTSGNTNYVGFVKDNLNSAPTLVTSNVVMAGNVSGTYTYISGIPYYSATGSPSITLSTLELQNFTGQTFRSADPFTLGAGTALEGTGSIIAAQTKTLAQINGTSSMLTGANVNANVGIASNYTMGNVNVLINGAVNAVANVTANIFNVVGTSTTVQLPTKIQVNAVANTGISEGNIAVSATLGSVYTDNGLRITGFGSAANTPAFNGATNNYTANVWSGAQTIAGTQEAVDRYGVVKHYVTDLSTGYLPVGPDLATGRSGLQYFTFAFRRATMANFDIRLTTTTGIAGLFIAAPGTTIDTGGFSSPTPGFPGPTSSLNGWLSCSLQYNGSGVPGATTASGGNGSNGVALTGADVVPLNSAIANVSYTMTLGSQNSSNSTGNNILVRIALNTNQTITALSIGDAV